MTIRGPYVYPSGTCAGRRFVQITNDEGWVIRQTLYSRWLMEQSLGYELPRSVHVHHVNEDKTDDRLENLEVISASDHAREHNLGKPSPFKGVEKGWTHGTMYAWMKKKCECQTCEEARRSFNDKRIATRDPARRRGPYDMRKLHGYTRYRAGCRCDVCRKGNTDYKRANRQKKAREALSPEVSP